MTVIYVVKKIMGSIFFCGFKVHQPNKSADGTRVLLQAKGQISFLV